MRRVRKLLIFLSLVIIVNNSTAQTKVQRGVARMITRTATDPIVPVQGVQIVVGNVANKASDKSGRFTMNIAVNKEQSYQVSDVRLPKGSTLLLASPTKKKKLFLSKNDLEVALITPEDKNTVSKATYRKLLKKYNQQAEQLRQLRTQLEYKQLELEENSAEYSQLTSRIDSIQRLLNQYFDEKNHENTTKEIERIAEELTLTDYQSLEAEDAHIYNLMQEADWPMLSAYLLKLMNGDAAAYVQEAVDQKNAAKEVYDKTSKELAHRLERIENAIESYKMQHLNDSVSRYYEILVEADSTNWEYLNQAGSWEGEYMARYDNAMKYYLSALTYTELDTLKATTYNNIGFVYYAQNNYEEALEYFQKALTIQVSTFGEKHPDVARNYNNIGSLFLAQGKYDKAIEFIEKSLIINQELYGENHTSVASDYNNIGSVYYEKGEPVNASKYHRMALKIWDSQHTEDFSKEIATAKSNIGSCICNGQFFGFRNIALKYFQESLALRISIYGENHPLVAKTYNNIGATYYQLEKYDDALTYYQKALEIFKSIYGDKHLDMAESYNGIGTIYGSLGDYDKSLENIKKALEINKVILGENHPSVAKIYDNVGKLYFLSANYSEAMNCFSKAYNILTDIVGEEHPTTKAIKENIEATKKKLAKK